MYPKKLVFIIINDCDYEGEHNNNGMLYLIPYNHLFGIQACENHKDEARNDCYNYCVNNGIYPINEYIVDLFPKSLIIKRTGGKIEKDWELMIFSCTYKVNNDIAVRITHNNKEIVKYTYLHELCKLNNMNYNDIIEKLYQELKKFYGY